MGKRGAAAIVGASAAITLMCAPGASAATEVGSRCGANTATPVGSSITLFQKAKGAGDPLPILVPTAGILTEWKLLVAQNTPASFPLKVKVFRGEGGTGQIVADSEGTVKEGANAFAAQIPVEAGDQLGLHAAAGNSMLSCDTNNPADITAPGFGEAAVGSTLTIEPIFQNESQVPVTAVIEPDADGDGFGDETQDKCPQRTDVQAACLTIAPPAPIALNTKAVVKKGSVLVLVSASSEAAVTVSGTVKVAARTKRAHNSALLKLRGSTQTVKPDQVGRFPLIFTKSLKSALGAVPPKKSLKLSIQVSATNPSRQVFKAAATARLKGRAK